MFKKQTAIAGVVSALAMFMTSYLLFGVIFASVLTSAQNPALQSAMEGMANMPLLFLSYLVLAWMMAFIYPLGYKGGSKVAEGFRFGIVVWVLVAVSSGLDWLSWGLFSGGFFFLNIALYFIQFAVGGIVIGLLASGGDEPAPADVAPAEDVSAPVGVDTAPAGADTTAADEATGPAG